tara:strand:+ start:13578 stop:14480 length:903 start_codon:yes stop_codon:yes gene_type:complete
MKRGLNVLSLFDGMSGGRIALDRLGIPVDNYFACEIDKYAMEITEKNYPYTVQLGSVTELDGTRLLPIDLFIGGSPCQSFSMAGAKEGFGGESKLFWEYVRLLNEVKEKNPDVLFLLENVPMKQEWEDILTEALGVKPIEINSNLVSAQNRRRLFWTNIPDVRLPEDKGIYLKDILLEEPFHLFTDERIENSKVLTKNYVKWDISQKGYYSQQDRAYYKDGKMCCIPKSQVKSKTSVVEGDGVYRRLSPVEIERLQTVPDDYTSGVSDTQRYMMLGNGWTIDVIAHIFSFIPVKDLVDTN